MEVSARRRHAAHEDQVGDVGAGDEENQSRGPHEEFQAFAVLLLHVGDADSGGVRTTWDCARFFFSSSL